MSRDDSQTFKKFQREHARLHDPVSLHSSVELIPVRTARTASTKIGEKKQNNAPPVAQESTDTLSIVPTDINCSLDLFQALKFEVKATDAQRCDLIWRCQADPEWQRVAMDYQGGDKFSAAIGIDDGEYLFGYGIDGCVVPDAHYAQRLLLLRDGAFSLLKLVRYSQLLTIYNSSDIEMSVRIESDVKWLVPESDFIVPAHRKQQITVKILPGEMAIGTNHTSLRVVTNVDGQDFTRVINVEAYAEAAGAIPQVEFFPNNFGHVTQGTAEIILTVEIRARGRGLLRGIITLEHSSEVADLKLDADLPSSRFSHRFTIASINLPCRDDGKVKLTLVTDSYLANYRLFKADVPYRLTYLKKSLPVLNFKQVRQGMAGTIRLEVARSDNQEIELEAIVPSYLTPYVEWHTARPGVYVFRFSPQGLKPNTLIDEEVILQDRRSGLRTQLRLLAEVIGYSSNDFSNSAKGNTQGSAR